MARAHHAASHDGHQHARLPDARVVARSDAGGRRLPARGVRPRRRHRHGLDARRLPDAGTRLSSRPDGAFGLVHPARLRCPDARAAAHADGRVRRARSSSGSAGAVAGRRTQLRRPALVRDELHHSESRHRSRVRGAQLRDAGSPGGDAPRAAGHEGHHRVGDRGQQRSRLADLVERRLLRRPEHQLQLRHAHVGPRDGGDARSSRRQRRGAARLPARDHRDGRHAHPHHRPLDDEARRRRSPREGVQLRRRRRADLVRADVGEQVPGADRRRQEEPLRGLPLQA